MTTAFMSATVLDRFGILRLYPWKMFTMAEFVGHMDTTRLPKTILFGKRKKIPAHGPRKQ